MSHLPFLATVICALLLGPLGPPLAAQSTSRDTSVLSATATELTVVSRSSRDSVVLSAATRAPAWTQPDVAHAKSTFTSSPSMFSPESSQSAAVMVIGGAAMFAGAIISGRVGTIMMLSGGVVGLVGLWAYAR